MAYIDRQKLIEHIEADIQECGEPDTNARPVIYGTILGLKGALSFAQTLPTADVAEVRHGEWRLHPDGSGTCNQCGRTQKAVWDFDNAQEYCGKCGAKMDGGKAE